MFKKAIPKFPVLDVNKAISFYKDKLGFEELFVYDNYAGVGREHFELLFWECDDKYLAENTACRVEVDDIDKIYAEYQVAGVIHPRGELEVKPWGLKEFVILDQDGNAIFFFEEIEEK